MRTLLLAGLGFLLLSMAGTGVGRSQTPSATTLIAPGEELVPFQNGCAQAIRLPTAELTPEQVTQRAQALANMRQFTWRGPCVHGLAHGRGTFTVSGSSVTTEFVYGQQFYSVQYNATQDIAIASWSAPNNGGSISANLPPRTRMSVDSLALAPSQGGPNRIQVNADRTIFTIQPDMASCRERHVRSVVQRCGGMRPGGGDIDTVYGVMIWRSSFDPATYGSTLLESIFTPCPDILQPTNCDGAWLQAVTPILERARPIIAAAEQEYARKLQERTALYEPLLRPFEIAAAEALVADEQERQREAAAFRASLQTMNAGQLFNRADELQQSGDNARASQVRRVLIERFPDSPLAGTAAQQLSGGGGIAMPASTPQAAPRRQRSCMDYLNQHIGAVNDGNQPTTINGRSNERIVAATGEYLRMARSIAVCQSEVASLQRDHEAAQGHCRNTGAAGCQNGVDDRPVQYRQAMQRSFDSIVAQARADAGGQQQAAAPAQSNQCARTPDQELAAYNAEVEQVRQRNPIPSAGGSRDQFVWMASFAAEGLRRLEPHRACLGPHYETNRSALANARNTAVNGCEGLSTSTGEAARAACIMPMQ